MIALIFYRYASMRRKTTHQFIRNPSKFMAIPSVARRFPNGADYEIASHPTSVVDMSTGKVIDCKYWIIINGKKVPAYRNENGEVVPAPMKMASPEVFNQTPIMHNLQKQQQASQPKPGIFQKAKNWFQQNKS